MYKYIYPNIFIDFTVSLQCFHMLCIYVSYGAKSEANAIKQVQMSLLSPHTHTHTLSSLPCALTNQANNSGFHNRTKRGDGGRDGMRVSGMRVKSVRKVRFVFLSYFGLFQGQLLTCRCQLHLMTTGVSDKCTCICTYIPYIYKPVYKHIWADIGNICAQLSP